MIITPNNTPVTIGPAWPCCYQYPTTAPNITGNHTNVSFEEIKRRFYNSIKTVEVTFPNITPYVGTYVNGNPLGPNGIINNGGIGFNSWVLYFTDQEAYDLASQCCSIVSGMSMTLYGNTWFHSDDDGYGYGPFYPHGTSCEFFATNAKHSSFTLNGNTFKCIIRVYFVGNLGPETSTLGTEYQAQNIVCEVYIYDPQTLIGLGNPFLNLTFGKKCDKNLANFTVSDFSGNFGSSTRTSYASVAFGNEYFVSDTTIQRQLIGAISLNAYYDDFFKNLLGFKTLNSSLIANGPATVTATAPSTSDWDFSLSGFTVNNSQSMFIGQTTPGQNATEMDNRLSAPSLSYSRTGDGIYKCDPVSIGIANYDGWPVPMYYECRKYVSPGFNTAADTGSIVFNSAYANQLFGPSFYLKPYLIPLANLKVPSDYTTTYNNPYNNGIIAHPDAPVDVQPTQAFISWDADFLAISSPGDYYYTGVKMSTPYKYISVPFRFFEHRINKSQAGSASISGYMPPFQDW